MPAGADTRPILLVEDYESDIELTLWAFRSSGIANTVIVARDGVEALELLYPNNIGQEPLRPALVLLDLNKPRMGGLETLQHLRAHPSTRSLPVIMLTSSRDDQDLLSSHNLGANSYVEKPVDAKAFLSVAKALGVDWLNTHRQVTTGQTPAFEGHGAPPGPVH